MTTVGQLLRQSDTPLRGIAKQTGYSPEFALLSEEYGALDLLDALDRPPPDRRIWPATPPGPRTVGAGALPLTLHEYLVASLTMAGDSDDEIAGKLHTSRRAVEFHLTNIYRKLDGRRRTPLSAAFADET